MNFSNYFNNLIDQFEIAGVNNFSNDSPRPKSLLLLYVFYHYFVGDTTKHSEIEDGVLFPFEPGYKLDGLYLNNENDGEDVYLDFIYSEYYKNEEEFLSDKVFNENKYYFNKLKAIISDLYKRNFGIFTELKTRFNTLVDSENPIFNVKFITNIAISEKNRKLAQNRVLQYKKLFGKVATFEMVYGDEIVQEIEEVENPAKYVESGKLVLENPKSILYFNHEKSLITSISALSLKTLYRSYWKLGLFASNLRYYVKIAKIDSEIQKTIQENPELFWYKNNGLIIICDNYEIIGNEITLSNFSIINGGQTTKLIGDTEFDKDFFVITKIIKNKAKTEEEKDLFALDIAEATNSQKPIKPRDLISNKPEQRMLKKNLIEKKIYLQIKRGDKHNKKQYKEAWQFIDNDELTQLFVAGIFQDPSLAKNKTKLLTIDSLYDLVYPIDFNYNSDFIKDILFLRLYQSDYLYLTKQNHNPTDDPFKISILKYTKLINFALVSLLIKVFFNKILTKVLNKSPLSKQEQLYLIKQRDINFPFINHKNANNKELFIKIFDKIYKDIVLPGYNKYSEDTGNIDPSVFAKNTSVYKDYLISIAIPLYLKEMNEKEELGSLLKAILIRPNSETEKYINSSFQADFEPDIQELLRELRKDKAKFKGIPENKVFSEKAINKISDALPTSINDLANLNILTLPQFNTYGGIIVECVQDYLGRKNKK
jgi:hypothetical protein